MNLLIVLTTFLGGFTAIWIAWRQLKKTVLKLSWLGDMYFLRSRFYTDEESGIIVHRLLFCKAKTKESALKIINGYMESNTNDPPITIKHIATFKELVESINELSV